VLTASFTKVLSSDQDSRLPMDCSKCSIYLNLQYATGLCSLQLFTGLCTLQLFTGLCTLQLFTGLCSLQLFTGLCSLQLFTGLCSLQLFTGLCNLQSYVFRFSHLIYAACFCRFLLTMISDILRNLITNHTLQSTRYAFLSDLFSTLIGCLLICIHHSLLFNKKVEQAVSHFYLCKAYCPGITIL